MAQGCAHRTLRIWVLERRGPREAALWGRQHQPDSLPPDAGAHRRAQGEAGLPFGWGGGSCTGERLHSSTRELATPSGPAQSLGSPGAQGIAWQGPAGCGNRESGHFTVLSKTHQERGWAWNRPLWFRGPQNPRESAPCKSCEHGQGFLGGVRGGSSAERVSTPVL